MQLQLSLLILLPRAPNPSQRPNPLSSPTPSPKRNPTTAAAAPSYPRTTRLR
ncbi:hypothetical protein K458DRAFT_417850 [Lentithecium fluviatile CBS 122367]|uniref:Uncharacterized protein n=1 Tax=Lentithecium fluviatile CBS 122367 TaxID=1168545 RepID=A0A6G1J230_9PLEO|nr:hypothetical protein K458DRAFT_417850 [Lentithecium fluviatile CBS 122367]